MDIKNIQARAGFPTDSNYLSRQVLIPEDHEKVRARTIVVEKNDESPPSGADGTHLGLAARVFGSSAVWRMSASESHLPRKLHYCGMSRNKRPGGMEQGSKGCNVGSAGDQRAPTGWHCPPYASWSREESTKFHYNATSSANLQVTDHLSGDSKNIYLPLSIYEL